MPIAAPIQNSFNAGEFSPLAYGRTDYPKYKSGGTLVQNLVPLIQGGLTRRPGFRYVNRTKANGRARLMPFVFSDGDAFLLEIGDQYMRFFQNRGPVLNAAQNITGISNAHPAVVTYSGADNFVNGKEVYIAGVVGMSGVNGKYFIVANVNTGANTFELNLRDGGSLDSTALGTWTSGGTVATIYEIVSPYILADVDALRRVQDGDVVYIVHPDYKPQKLSRAAATSWTFSDAVFLDGPYLPQNTTTTTLTPAAATGTNILLTASAVGGINGGQGFLSTDVGRFVRLKQAVGNKVGWAIIKTYNSTTTVHVDIQSDFGDTTATLNWRLGEWSATTGYPSVVFFFEDRLSFAASPAAPLTLNASKTGDYLNMAPTDVTSVVTADSALQLKLNSGQQDPIRWVADDGHGLLMGTRGAEWVIRSSLTGEAISALNLPSAQRATRYGSAAIDPISPGNATLFVTPTGRKLREMAYDYQVDGYQAPDMTVLAEHMTESGIKGMAFQKEPFSLIWAYMNDGSLKAMTYDRLQGVIAWHRHPVGGFSDVAQSLPAIVESTAVIPAPDASQDDVFIVVNRYINGGIKRYIEYGNNFNMDFSDQADCFFVDAGLTVTFGSPSTAITGLDHLEGQMVQLLADGAVLPTAQVAQGAITASVAASKFQIGLGSLARFQSLRPEAGSATGTAMGKIKRTHRLAALLHQTLNLRVGMDFSTMDRIQFRTNADPMDQAPPLFSGVKPLDFADDYNFDGFVCLEQDQPLPFTMTALMPQLHTQDAQ